MKAALVQYSPEWENVDANITKINDMINKYTGDDDILVFPEMTLTGFTMSSSDFGEDIDGKSFVFFMNLAKKLKKHIFAGIIEREDDKLFNSLIHFDNNGLIHARYRKIHPFSMGQEDKNYTAGDEPVISKIDNHLVGLSVCYDLRFPELYRRYAKEGVSIMINIANWPEARIEHWKTLLRARAIEDQCFMIGVNRVGTDPQLKYPGCSTIFDPMGKQLIEFSDKPGIYSAELDMTVVETTRVNLPYLKDMKLI